MRALLLRATLVALPLLGCEQPSEAPRAPTGAFGIFFGGQIQQRRDIPFELDRTKQSQGFRVELSAPLSRDIVVEWRVDKPRPKGPTSKATPGPGVTPAIDPAPEPSARATLPAGETRFDHTLPFEPGDPLGVWNVRVVADGKIVIDRPFEVYDPGARARAAADGGMR